MSLSGYRKKRKFDKTPEPTGGTASDTELIFVVQKHDASHLHYDFRLELSGTLKSWAVPKGPSLDPDVKRLAMMVEDHPYDYRTFEGIIPKGQYGGGTVIVWDHGTYEPVENSLHTKKEKEKLLSAQLRKGKVSIRLSGKKLKGDFTLVKSTYQGENSWLLIKGQDKYARDTDITLKVKSVISGKTIKQMEKSPDRIYGKNKSKSVPRKKIAVNGGSSRKNTTKVDIDLRKTLFPTDLSPMLATLASKPFDDPGWLYEIKWDGYRAMAFLNKGKAELKSRNQNSFNEKFDVVYNALTDLKVNAVIDGEIVILNEDGRSDFGKLQNWGNARDGQLVYFVFDLLWLNGYSLMDLTLTERREQLRQIIPEHTVIKLSDDFQTTGTAFFEVASQMGLEGIMAKKADSPYIPGSRTLDWLKLKISKRHEVVIGGYTKNEGSGKFFSSLLVGVYDGGVLRYTGKIGTGFSDRLQKQLLADFRKIETSQCPFDKVPDVNKKSRFSFVDKGAVATWLKPKLVCEVAYTEITSDGVMRHPSFIGMREDKAAAEVVKEIGVQMTRTGAQKVTERVQLLPENSKKEKKLINKKELDFTNLDKIYWPAEKIQKRAVINYYHSVAEYMLPYLKDRPQSLNRHPNGINGESFYQKNIAGKFPSWIMTHDYENTTKDGAKKFFVCTDEASLLYMANLGCIEINPWHSRITSADRPDFCIIDLDPDTNPFSQVIEAAQIVHQVLKSLGVPSYPKTSGSTGIHIYIPLAAAYGYEQSRMLAELVVTLVHREIPAYTSLERSPSKRKGKIYLDFLQNRSIQTIAAPYSLRPKPGATVSMPLEWDEIKTGLSMKDFNISNAYPRIKNSPDIFKPVLGKGIVLEKVLQKLEQLL